MQTEIQILIEYLTLNGFSKVGAEVYVNSLSENPQESTNLNFNAVLGAIELARKKKVEDNSKLIKQLNVLKHKLGSELDILLKNQERNDISDLAQAENQLNSEYYQAEISEIDDLVKSIEKDIK